MRSTILKRIFIFVALLNCGLFYAQEYEYTFKNYDWNQQSAIEIPEQYKNEKEVILERIIKIEIAVAGKNVKQYRLMHDKIYINSDDAIERNNKIYIPFGQNETVLTNKARVILKNGKTITLDKNDIKEEIDEEKGVKYNYFAINGLEKGAVIEKFFVLEESPDLNGKTYKMQGQYPIVDLNFEMIYPEHLVFKTKNYNNLTEPIIDTKKFDKKSVLSISEKNIAALANDEQYSNWDVKLKLFRYKLNGNTYNGANNLYNFKEFATNIYERLNPELDKKGLKAVEDFCKTIPKSNDLEDQIWNIENKIKKTIAFGKYIDQKETLLEVINSKQASEIDILKLYLAVFKNFKIENNVVFTSSRYNIPFDKDFESYENLNDLLIYFPTIKKYLTPTEIEYRIPLFPSILANNNGLFLKEKLFAGVAMGISEMGFIEIPGSEITHDFMDITIDFTKDIENPSISSRIAFGGYAALNFQPIKDFASAEQYKTMLKSVAENYTVETEYQTLTTENDGTDFVGKKPFVMNVTFEGKDLIQKAGENYLFSVGQTIGRQMEFYQENKRVLPVEIDYPHYYTRTLKIKLPKGASVKNLDKFNMDFKTDINGKTEAAFTSKFKQENEEITVENTEFYNIINYPLSTFESYKAVLNAAADFNKIVIIVTK